MRPTFETIRPCDGSYTCSGTSHLSSCLLALPHERNGDDPTETLGHRNGARVVRGEPSPKVLRPTPEISAREVLASCDHSQFGTVTSRDDGGTWVSSCSGCRTTLGLARYSLEDVPLDAPDKLLAVILDRQARAVRAQAAVSAWIEEAEDYLAQENPPLPYRVPAPPMPATFVLPEDLRAAAIRLVSEHLRPGCTWPTNEELGGGPTGDRDIEYRAGFEDQAGEILDLILPVIASALNGGRR